MSTDTKYNGWTNRETWLYGLWFDSDYDAELAQSAWDDAEADSTFTREERARLDLAETLEQNFTEYLEQSNVPSTGIVSDLLQGAIGAINWQEIAQGLMSDVDKSADTSKDEFECEVCGGTFDIDDSVEIAKGTLACVTCAETEAAH